ncbi:MAG: amidohydrolase family protein [Planctomycetota bacterium]
MRLFAFCLAVLVAVPAPALAEPLAIRGDLVHTMAGDAIKDGVVLIDDGKITAVGPAEDVEIPQGTKTLTAAVVTPGFIDARATVGLTGILNQSGDQDQLDTSSAMQPELRAIDAINMRDPLIDYVRGFGTTTVHTGHAPGELISGQTAIIKLRGDTIEEAVFVSKAMVAATLGNGARRDNNPGTRGKMVAMLRQELLKARDYAKKLDDDDDKNDPAANLKLAALADVLAKKSPLLVHAERAQDISSAIRLAEEFGFDLVLDSAAEAHMVTEQIAEAGVPVFVHPLMQRAVGERENQSFETPQTLKNAGVSFALQTGFEAYVPKVRVLLFEAQMAAAHGLSPTDTLAAITIQPATLLGIDDRVGSLEVGKDADLVLFDGDPLEYTSHAIATIVDGEVLSEGPN